VISFKLANQLVRKVKAHVLQHVPFEGLGSFEPWLTERGADIRYTRFFEGDPLPDLGAVDLLVVMGGPMSVNDEADFPWLKLEKQTIRQALARHIRVLGVCLGAQLIASALKSRCILTRLRKSDGFRFRDCTRLRGRFAFRRNAPYSIGTVKRLIFLEVRSGSHGALDARIRRFS
jgi:cobyric acid synthase